MMGIKAVESIIAGEINRSLIVQNGKVDDIDLFESVNITKKLDETNMTKAKILSI